MSALSADESLPAVPLSRNRRIVVTAGLLLGMTLGALEATVVATAMPTVIARLGGLEHYSWVFSAYLLTSTASVPVWGRLSDLRGRRKLYLIGITIFLVGSALCGAAQSMLQLVAARAIQGLGAGCIVPIAITIIGEIYTLRERARMQAVFSGMWGVASILGPLVGGYLTDAISWRWIFYINVPPGIVGALIVARTLPRGAPAHHQSVDWTGALLLTASITALLVGFSDVASQRWPWFAVSAVCLAGLVVSYQRTEEPILPLSLLVRRLVALSNMIVFLVGIAMFGAVAFVPLFVQGTMGLSATGAGQVLTPLFLGWVTTSIIGARLLLTLGYRLMTQAGVAMVTAAFVLLSFLGDAPRWATLMWIMALLGAGMGFSMLSLLLHVQRSVSRAELGLATSLNQFSRSIGGAVGVAIMGGILATGMAAQGGLRVAEGAAASAVSLDPASRAALAAALRRVFGTGAIISAAGFLFALGLPAPEEERGVVSAGAGEQMIAAEMVTLDSDGEPVGVDD
jgi:EmrB/QacA subfamily drug resistance transporter